MLRRYGRRRSGASAWGIGFLQEDSFGASLGTLESHAHSRGGWRAVGINDAGVIQPGYSAHVSVWGNTELVVQAPDARIAQWSTDPSSGTPVLPLLGADVPLPDCLMTISDGRIIYDADRLG